MMYYEMFKALHIVGFVSWFAGLFYIVRIFIYHVEAAQRPEHEREILQNQFSQMMQRVYAIIMNPAMMITWTGGLAMILRNLSIDPQWLALQTWLHVKLLLLLGLSAYHLHAKRLMRQLTDGSASASWTGERLRLWNEVATLFLVAIVLLAVFRNLLNFGYAMLFMVGFFGLLMAGIKAYKRHRQKSS